jgi:hypothetical protein
MRGENRNVSIPRPYNERRVKLSGGPSLLFIEQKRGNDLYVGPLAYGVRMFSDVSAGENSTPTEAKSSERTKPLPEDTEPTNTSYEESALTSAPTDAPEMESNSNLEVTKSTNSSSTNAKILYEKVTDLESLKTGLKRLNPGASPGVDGETKANLSEKKINSLHKSLKGHKYQPKPNRRVPIPKPGGGERYLGIASAIDKVVQASLLNHLEPIAENMFLDESFGFRPGRSCHDAL